MIEIIDIEYTGLNVGIIDNDVIVAISATLLVMEAKGVHKLVDDTTRLTVAVTAGIERHSLSPTNATDVTRAPIFSS